MIYGVAVNDLPNHVTQITKSYTDESGKKKRKVTWQCPYYTKWFAMLTRCYKKSEVDKHPTYANKTVCDDWLRFSNFKTWMEKQDWEQKNLDKDILFENNTIYSPNTCVFISQELNKFVLEKSTVRTLPIGVSYHKSKRKYIAASAGKQIGAYETVGEAAIAWAVDKLDQAKRIVSSENVEVANAIVKRYTEKLSRRKEKFSV